MFASRRFIGILLLQLLISLNNFNGIFGSPDQYEGDACEWKGKPGVCTVLKDCKSLTNELMAKIITPYDLENCGFKGNDIVACCTDIDPSTLPKKPEIPTSGSTLRPNVLFPTHGLNKKSSNQLDTKLITPVAYKFNNNITVPKDFEFIDLTELLFNKNNNNQLNFTLSPFTSLFDPYNNTITQTASTPKRIGKNQKISKAMNSNTTSNFYFPNDERIKNFVLHNNFNHRLTSTTPRSSITENADSSENGNKIDVEVTTIDSSWRKGDNPFAAFEFRTTTVMPVRDLDSILKDIFNKQPETTTVSALSAITDYPIRKTEITTTVKSNGLDSWMLQALEESKKPTVTTTTTTTTTTPRSDIGFIDLSRKRTTTTTTPPPIISNGNKNDNLQTVWVVQNPSLPQQPSQQNGQLSNWNNGQINQQNQPLQNWNGHIQQQNQPNWNRPIQQKQPQPQQQPQNWNKATEPITVIVVEEEEPSWNQRGRGSRFRQNRQQNLNQPAGSGFNINSNFNSNNQQQQQQQFQTQHHTWNGNGFNQVRPIQGNSNIDFVAFPVTNSAGNVVSGNIGNSNRDAIQLSTTITTLNPDNPFLKSILNPVPPPSQTSAQLIQLQQPNWNNNNNRQSRGFQSDDPYFLEKVKKKTTTENPQTPNRISKRPAEVACDNIRRDFPGKRLEQKIIEGKAAEIGEYPHMAALGFGSSPYAWNCAGSLISDRYVLTAGHCVKSRTNVPVIVRMGRNNIKEVDPDDLAAIDIPIENITLHKRYKSTEGYNDIALIKLAQPVTFQSGLHPACLYTKPEDLSETMNLTIAGWGTTDVLTRAQSQVLQKATVRTVSLDKCSAISILNSDRRLPRGILNSQLCANDEKSDTCQGDSGGPLQIADESIVLTVVGITSLGVSCGTDTPGVYTRVASYVDWIESVVWPTSPPN